MYVKNVLTKVFRKSTLFLYFVLLMYIETDKQTLDGKTLISTISSVEAPPPYLLSAGIKRPP